MTESPTAPIRTGGHRSVEILRELANTRIGALAGPRASRAVGELAWQNAQSYAIQRDNFRSVWHAGHVTALLSNDVDVVAATQTGGVWLLKSIPGPTALAGYVGIPLSDAWDAPDVSCLAWGSAAGAVYAGCTGGSAIILLEFDIVQGGLFLRQSTVLPVPFIRAAAIITLGNPNRIVVATGERGGIWWSPIPKPATNATGYEWQAAQGLQGFATYRGLAAGPGASVAVAREGGSLEIGAPSATGIYRGTFEGDALLFTESSIQGIDPSLMRRTSLASCEDQPDRMYAVSAAGDGTILAVLASRDGGTTWRARGAPDKTKAGLRGSYNNCIAVSPQRADLVVIGWLSGGPFWSEDGAQSWRQPHNQETSSHLHNDLHAVCLGRNPSGPEPLYVGGDGGIVVTRDMGQTYHSQFNRPLNNLQFYGARASVLGTYGGSLTASSRYPGLLAGGTQDNGNVYRCPDRLRDPLPRPRQADMPWLRQMGGDGDLNRFVDPLGILLNFNNGEPRLGMAIWDERTSRFPEGRGTIIPADDDANGVAPTSVELVPAPAFRKNGHLMYAVVGSASAGAIHGLFAANPVTDRPDAREVTLIRLGAVGGTVTAIGTIDGSALMIGTDTGRIVSFDSASGATAAYALPDVVADGVVSRIEVFTTPVLAGSLPDNAFALVGGRILRFNGLFWATTTGADWTAFAFDALSSRLFAASDGDVFVSTDWGLSWGDASQGLPARPHCADLRIAADGSGGRDLYLATYGRSVWRATIAKRSEIFDLPPEATELLIGVLEDGGGLVRLGGKVIKIPPRPLTRDVFVALVAADIAQSMSEGSEANSRAILRTTLQQIASLALREVDRLG